MLVCPGGSSESGIGYIVTVPLGPRVTSVL
jgi:hypothetical protein